MSLKSDRNNFVRLRFLIKMAGKVENCSFLLHCNSNFDFMKKLIFFFAISTFLIACGDEAPRQETTQTAAASLQTEVAAEPAKPPCTIEADILPGNERWLREAGVVVCVLADSTTRDADLGDSHRILEVLSTDSCRSIFRQTLPVDRSPDFHYQIADILYNKVTQIVALKSFGQVHCYDLRDNKMLPVLKPAFATRRAAADAQSGMIQRLEVWENYLIGYAQDYGTFIFDLEDRHKSKAVLPVAEFKKDDDTYNSLFLLNSHNGAAEQQAIMPRYDAENDKFILQPVFQSLTPVNADLPKGAKNNRYVILRKEENKIAVAIDMQNQAEAPLPEDVAAKNTKEILKWLAASR